MHVWLHCKSLKVIDNSKSKNLLISYEIDKAYSYFGANDHDSSSRDDDDDSVFEDDEWNMDYLLWCNI